MSSVAIIPARGGSKRLPRKNILPIQGRPMIAYPIQAAVECGLFEQVLVSTEDEEIALEASKYGAKVIHRPQHLAEDRATVAQVCVDVLENLMKENSHFDSFCCIYATAVFIEANDIIDSYKILFESPTADCVMGVSKYNLHPVQALKKEKNYLKYNWPEYANTQSQFFPEFVASNGTLYWAQIATFLQKKTFYVERLKGYEIPWSRAVDINTKDDYELLSILADHYLEV